MDSYRPHQQQYMRPPPPPPPPQPPPSTSDPYHYPPPPPPPPPQQQGAWFPNQNQNQYQYHSLQSPSPPQQWGPPPHAEHLPPPPGSYPPPYSTHHYQPQSRPQGPPPPQSYHPQQFNQEWGAQIIRPNNQGWDYPPVHNKEQHWTDMARAWASRTTVDNQEQQSQFVTAGRPEEQSHYYDHYNQSHFQQVPVTGAPTHQPPGSHLQDATSGYAQHNLVSASPSVNQQEVPSSYSSVTGKDASAELNEQSYNFLPMPNSSGHDGQHYMQQSHQTPFGYSSHSGDPITNPADQPLEFASGFNVDHGGAHASTYAYHDSLGGVRGVDPATTMPSINTWTSSTAPGVVYPPHLPTLPSGTQPDMAIPPPVTGNAPHSFGSFPGLSLQPTIPTSGPPFALTAGISNHSTVAFPGDSYGVSALSERPKKAAVPSWMREEVLKRGITRSTMDHPKEEEMFAEDEGVDRSFGKGDQADSKSIDSSRSTEEEDDEDEVEAARTMAINKEIKRILTEVLSTVTDELFDEIATKVLSEDDLTPEVGHGRLPSNHKILPSTQAVATPKGSANVLILANPREFETEDTSKKSSFSTPGDILGLANYATDDDDDDDGEDDAILSSGVLNSGKDDLQQSTIRKPHDVIANGTSPVEVEEHSRRRTSMPNNLIKASSIDSKSTLSDIDSRMILDQRDQQESKGDSLKDKEVEGGKRRTDEKGENHRRLDERPSRKERTDDQNGSKENIKDKKVKLGEKAKESDTRKRSSHSDVEEDRREGRDSSKEDVSRKRERTKNKGDDRTRHKHSTDSRHKRRHSSSIDSKDNVVNHANHSSDESSEDSKRKLHSRRRHLSPSPVRSRKRQVSRSPHSKHYQRRHSPYSSIDSNRGKKSRSKPPVRRQR